MELRLEVRPAFNILPSASFKLPISTLGCGINTKSNIAIAFDPMARGRGVKKSGIPSTAENANSEKRARANSSPKPNKRQKQQQSKPACSDEDGTSKAGEDALKSSSFKARQPGQIRTPPPDPPTSVPASQILVPPEADDPVLRDSHDIHTIPVAANSKIQDKVRRVMSVLLPNETAKGDDSTHPGRDVSRGKTDIVALVSRAVAANKCITVAEIAKRELGKANVRIWQYSGSWSRLETVEPKKERKSAANGSDNAVDERSEDGSEDEAAFEVMDTPDRKIVRNIPCLVIYLSGKAIPRLKSIYG